MIKELAKLIVNLVFIVLVVGGWGQNIYKLIRCDFEAPYKTEIIRTIGIAVFPMGVVAGWMDIGEEENTSND